MLEFKDNAQVTSIKGEAGKLSVEILFNETDKKTFQVEIVLFALGRQADLEKLNLQEIGVNINENSRKIPVDDYCETNVKDIFAISDVLDGKPIGRFSRVPYHVD